MKPAEALSVGIARVSEKNKHSFSILYVLNKLMTGYFSVRLCIFRRHQVRRQRRRQRQQQVLI